ncbi:MAG: arginine repressor [bacterium]|nr:arginine repressor [bacterium]
MMKSTRQKAILDVIQTRDVETQEELAAALRARNIHVTQATVSRDIKELRLMKVMTPGGVSKYAAPYRTDAERGENDHTSRLSRILTESLLEVDCAGNMVVVKTLAGSAGVAGEALDGMAWPEALGTIAGDNTIFMVVRTPEDGMLIKRRIQDMIK